MTGTVGAPKSIGRRDVADRNERDLLDMQPVRFTHRFDKSHSIDRWLVFHRPPNWGDSAFVAKMHLFARL
jgi:hypothetical protein